MPYLILEFSVFVKPELELTFQVIPINVASTHLFMYQDETNKEKRKKMWDA